MSAIRVVYDKEPEFPATDQHHDAVRYRVGDYWVDALDGEPMLDEVTSFLRPSRSKVTEESAIDSAMNTPEWRALVAVFAEILQETSAETVARLKAKLAD